ncbi:MAG: FISUMP domain-containing protein [Bacilli bacterium]|nr:FISUMP domain-containing protein [Bacilli bacterium]
MTTKEKLGFTLIELLAVIVILAIIMLIATPAIANVIEDSKKGALKNSAYGLIKSAEVDYSQNLLKDSNPNKVTYTYNDGVEESDQVGYKLNYKGSKPENGVIIINENGEIALSIHDGTYCAQKGYKDSDVIISDKKLEKCKIPFSCGEELVDTRDNNSYKTVKIGDQCWFAEDLRYDCSEAGYNNQGSSNSWSGAPIFCGNQGVDYNGMLYIWAVAMKGSTDEGAQGLCPADWYIPTDNEWKILEMSLGMIESEIDKSDVFRGTNEGDKLKGVSPTWCNEESGCGESSFNALPAGYRTGGPLSGAGTDGYWWTSSSYPGGFAWGRALNSDDSGVKRYLEPVAHNANSVRCILGQ